MQDKGYDYYVGRNGVPRDYKQAVVWYRGAAEAGNALGMTNLGFMYEHGYGVGKDYKQAVTWYRKAAEAGDATGMYNLGVMYQYGYGVEEDLQQAITWFGKAARRGNPDAKKAIERFTPTRDLRGSLSLNNVGKTAA